MPSPRRPWTVVALVALALAGCGGDPAVDGGVVGDAGPALDGSWDAGRQDAGVADAGASDGGRADAGSSDGGAGRCPTAPRVCAASDAAEYVACVAQLNDGAADALAITARIECRGADACRAVISRAGPIEIYGTVAGAGLYRHDHYDYPLLYVQNARPLSVHDLVIDDDATTTCDATSCASSAAFIGCQDGLVERVELRNSKLMGLELASSTDMTFRAITVHDAASNGLWTSASVPGVNTSTRVENSTFTDNGTAAISLSGDGTAERPNVVSGNTLVHNHRGTFFSVCGASGTDPCPGGQLVLEHNLRFGVIEHNVIRDGSIEGSPSLATSGIEIAPDDVYDITIRDNDIHDNTGAAVILDPSPDPITVERVAVVENRIVDNGDGVILDGSASSYERDNCYEASCEVRSPSGTITPDSPTCDLGGGSQCSVTLTWTTTDAVDVSVLVGGGGLFGTGPSNTNTAPWVTSAGARFDLYDRVTLLDSARIRGVSALCP